MRSSFQQRPAIPDLVLGHDYLLQMGGAERVVASMLRRNPLSPLYTSAVRWDGLLPEFTKADLRLSWMQRIPRISTSFEQYYALYPDAFQSFGVVQAKAAWVSASTFAKCLRFAPSTATVLHRHSPTRFLRETDSYLNAEIANHLGRRLVGATLPALRGCDRQWASRFDVVVANSPVGSKTDPGQLPSGGRGGSSAGRFVPLRAFVRIAGRLLSHPIAFGRIQGDRPGGSRLHHVE